MACVMAYIVDLTMVMHRLPAGDAGGISKESVLSALKDYADSGEIVRVHDDIRTFREKTTNFRLRDKDHALDEIIRLVKKYSVPAPRA